MLNNLSSGSRRLVALLLLLATVAIILAVTLVPLHNALVVHDESIADLEFRLKKYQAMAQLEGPLKARLESLTSKQETAEGLLKGESQAIAGANLQAHPSTRDRMPLPNRLLTLAPLGALGAMAYSLYLWHWPPLVIAGEYLGEPLSAPQASGLLGAALMATVLTYRFIENPVRRSRFLAGRTGLTLGFGIILIGGTVMVAQWCIATHYGTWDLFANL